MLDTPISVLGGWPTVSVRLMRHGARALERYRTPGKRLSSCRLMKHRLINSLWTKVSERSEGVCPRRCLSALLNPHNFANTIAKPTRRKGILNGGFRLDVLRGIASRSEEHTSELQS